jgi:hypothetical protein
MNRWFNTAGPCQPEMHYMLPSMPRLPQLETLIDQAGYFVLHAPRQVGKTTAILTIAQKLTARGKYTAVMVSAEVGATFPHDPKAAQADILHAWDDAVRFWLRKMGAEGGLVMANPIYREVLPRVLTVVPMAAMPQIAPSWLNRAGELDTDALLQAFLSFWRQHGEPLLNSAAYHEIAPHLVLMAFLHRVVNGGGSLEREYAIGSDRMDLFLRYGAVRLGIELKVWRQTRPDPLTAGLEQLDGYAISKILTNWWQLDRLCKDWN